MKDQEYIYVYDCVRDEKRWVISKYVNLYPDIYKPIIVNGLLIKKPNSGT